MQLNARHGWNHSPDSVLEVAEMTIKMGIPNGYTMIGHMYRDGYGKSQSYYEAARYYGLAQQGGDAEGIYNLVRITTVDLFEY